MLGNLVPMTTKADALALLDKYAGQIHCHPDERNQIARDLEMIRGALRDRAEMLKALEGVIHHNAGLKEPYKLSPALIRHVQSAIDATKRA